MLFLSLDEIALALVAALVLDALLGEPEILYRHAPHPAVVMGRAVAFLDRALNSAPGARFKGVLALLGLIGGAALLGWLALFGGVVAQTIIAAALLAQRSLVDHVLAVADGLRTSLAEGRFAVSMIVGRDPETLDEAGVARAAIESAAENFSDGVVAPAFWFFVAGAPGVLIYKVVNTADSMIGHRSEKYRAFGWAAARFDDVLNLAPARLTGALLAIAGWSAQAFRAMARDASLHKSPNAGWPEAAAAGALGLSLAGPRIYGGVLTDDPFINPEGRRGATPEDVGRAVRLLWRAWRLLIMALLCIGLIAML